MEKGIGQTVGSFNVKIWQRVQPLELKLFRKVNKVCPICEKLSHKLTWSHYCELSKFGVDAKYQSINRPSLSRKSDRESQIEKVRFYENSKAL